MGSGRRKKGRKKQQRGQKPGRISSRPGSRSDRWMPSTHSFTNKEQSVRDCISMGNKCKLHVYKLVLVGQGSAGNVKERRASGPPAELHDSVGLLGLCVCLRIWVVMVITSARSRETSSWERKVDSRYRPHCRETGRGVSE